MVTEGSKNAHPSDAELAAYLGHEVRGEALRRLEGHLAECDVCRQEVIDAKEVLRPIRRVSWRVFAPAAAAAAVAVLLLPSVLNQGPPGDEPVHRETPAELRMAPSPASPVGSVEEVVAFVWARVSEADRYRITVFTSEGTVVWRATTVDSLATLPDSVRLQPNQPYLWRVEARVGWDVWESSDLIEFRIEDSRSISLSPGGSR